MARWLPLFLVLLLLSFPVLAQEIAVAAGADQFLAAWSDRERLQARRFDGSGVPLDAQPIVLSESPDARVAAAFDGVDYLVVWGDRSGVRARFLSSSETITLSTESALTAVPVDVAFNGVDFVVAWGANTSAYAALIRPAEGVIRSVVLDSRFVRHVAVSIGGDRDLILYAGNRGEAILDAQIVDRDLNPLATTRIDSLPNAPGCFGSRSLLTPDAVWTGGEWRLTWVQYWCLSGHSNLLAHLSPDGALAAARVVTPFVQGVVRSHLVLFGSEPALLTQFLSHGTPSAPVYLHLLLRNAPPRAVLPPVQAFAATVIGRNRLVLVYSSEEGVAVKIETIDLPPRMRRRAVR